MNWVHHTAWLSREEYIDNHLTACGPSDDDVCPICADEWDEENRDIVSTTCDHVYHKTCILTWFNSDNMSFNTCPSCRHVFFKCEDKDESDHDLESEFSAAPSVWSLDEDAYEEREAQQMMEEVGNDLAAIFAERLNPWVLQQEQGIDVTDSSDVSRFHRAVDRLCQEATHFVSNFPADLSEISEEGVTVIGDAILRALIIVAMIRKNGALMSLDEWIGMLHDMKACHDRAVDASNVAEGRNIEEAQATLHSIWMWMVPPSPIYTIKLSAGPHGERLRSLNYLSRQEDGSLVEDVYLDFSHVRQDLVHTPDFGVIYYSNDVEGGDELRIHEWRPGSISQASLADDGSVLTISTHRGRSLVITLHFACRNDVDG